MHYFPLACALLVLLSACNNSSTPSSSVASPAETSQLAPGWKTYEDDWFRLNYPETSIVAGAKDGKQNPEFPKFAAIPKSEDPGGGFGAFTLQFDVKSKGMLLRDAILSEMSARTKNNGTLLSPAKEVKVGNGRCMSAVASRQLDRCPKDQGSCYSASIVTVCEDYAGRRYSANSLLSHSFDPKQLSPQAQQEAAVYERILRSLEFKKS
ncbi:MAG: hypothetical protein FD126_1767 [Elusimicrobia bacterium]|nr:MAG: hypothetical protein FD126_1767 [Elusimicrobiota bacterium]